jgi:hypothetical protein
MILATTPFQVRSLIKRGLLEHDPSGVPRSSLFTFLSERGALLVSGPPDED